MGRAFIISNLRDYNFPFLSENKITRMFSIFLMKNGRLSLTYPRMDFFFFLKIRKQQDKKNSAIFALDIDAYSAISLQTSHSLVMVIWGFF